jgi:hypothetical protein
MHRFLPAALLVILGCHEAPSPTADEAFSVKGKPIHPACVYELLGMLADRDPVIAAVDVEGCAGSNRHARGKATRSADGWMYEHPELTGKGFFCYWWLGVTPQGTHAVLTADNGGGNGVFYSVLFLGLQERPYFNDGISQRRWMLSCLGEVVLGDRTRDRAELEAGDLVVRPPTGEPRRIPVPVF